MIAELEEAIGSGTVTSDARLPTETATSPAASGAISRVAIATSSGASGATSNASGAMSSGASGAPSNAACATSPAAFGAASILPLKSPASMQPAILVLSVVVTQHAAKPHFAAATLHAAAATPHAAAAAPHSNVVTQPAATLHAAAATPHVAAVASHSTVVSLPAAVPRSAAGAQLAFTAQRASTTLPTGEKPATVKKPAGFETLQLSRRRKTLAKTRPKKRAASEPEASSSEETPLPAERSAAARPSKGARLAQFKYANSLSSDSPTRRSESRPPSR